METVETSLAREYHPRSAGQVRLEYLQCAVAPVAAPIDGFAVLVQEALSARDKQAPRFVLHCCATSRADPVGPTAPGADIQDVQVLPPTSFVACSLSFLQAVGLDRMHADADGDHMNGLEDSTSNIADPSRLRHLRLEQ